MQNFPSPTVQNSKRKIKCWFFTCTIYSTCRFFLYICFLLSSPDPDDLAFLMNHLQPIAGHWRAVGLQLGLLYGELGVIEATPLLIPGGPVAYLQEVLSRWLDRATPFPTLTKLCGALSSHAVNQSRIALELEQQYKTQRTG